MGTPASLKVRAAECVKNHSSSATLINNYGIINSGHIGRDAVAGDEEARRNKRERAPSFPREKQNTKAQAAS